MRCSFSREASLHEPPAYFSCVRISGGTRRSVGGSAHVSATATYRVPSDAPSAARSIGSGLVVLPAPVLASSLSSHSTVHRRCEVTGVESNMQARAGRYRAVSGGRERERCQGKAGGQGTQNRFHILHGALSAHGRAGPMRRRGTKYASAPMAHAVTQRITRKVR